MKIAFGLFAAFVGLGAASCTQRAAHADCRGTTDCRPPLALTALDGATLGDDTLRGQAMLVNFWATWCAPCAKEIPGLQAVYERHRTQGFTIIGLVTGDGASDADVTSFAVQRGVTYPLVRGGLELERRFGLGDALPTSILYDRRGRLVQRWIGDLDENVLEAAVKKVLAD